MPKVALFPHVKHVLRDFGRVQREGLVALALPVREQRHRDVARRPHPFDARQVETLHDVSGGKETVRTAVGAVNVHRVQGVGSRLHRRATRGRD